MYPYCSVPSKANRGSTRVLLTLAVPVPVQVVPFLFQVIPVPSTTCSWAVPGTVPICTSTVPYRPRQTGEVQGFCYPWCSRTGPGCSVPVPVRLWVVPVPPTTCSWLFQVPFPCVPVPSVPSKAKLLGLHSCFRTNPGCSIPVPVTLRGCPATARFRVLFPLQFQVVPLTAPPLQKFLERLWPPVAIA
jgi:hypothetical protein